jgi:hypothetical protein
MHVRRFVKWDLFSADRPFTGSKNNGAGSAVPVLGGGYDEYVRLLVRNCIHQVK